MADSGVEVEGLPGPTVRELLLADSRPIRPILLEDRNDYLGETGVLDQERYRSPEFYRREVDMLWSRVWQIACREEHIPRVGDYVVYDIADKSLIVVRSAPDRIQAFFNACLHRNRALCEGDGHAANFRCRFHGMIWRLDGAFGMAPSRWDFPQLKEAEFRLPEANVGTWGGFVFVNLDPDAIPLEDYLADLPLHAEGWGYENRFVAAHVGQVIRANWKVAVEAFLENYHVMTTHSQVLPYVGDANSQYTVRKDRPHYSRLVFAQAIASPHVADQVSQDQVLEVMATDMGGRGDPEAWKAPSGRSPRQHAAELERGRLSAMGGGVDYSRFSDTEMIDGWVYSLFPNFTLWGGASNLFYRFRPWGTDPEMSMMEIMIMPPLPEGAPRPPPACMTLLGPDQTFLDAPELGPAGAFFNQDLENMAWVQKGMKAAKKPMILARYQESQILHFHRTLDRYLAGETPR